MDPDELLLARSATDPAAFEPLVHRHSPALYAYLARRVPSAAEDLLSEVWLSAYAGRGTYDANRGPARGWLFGIARNAVVTHLRRPNALPLGYGGAEDPGWDDVDDRLDARRRAPALSAAIQSLPGAERELLLLIALDGLSPSEAGAAMGIPPGTARSRLHRARTRIREQLEGDEPSSTAPLGGPRSSSFLPGVMP